MCVERTVPQFYGIIAGGRPSHRMWIESKCIYSGLGNKLQQTFIAKSGNCVAVVCCVCFSRVLVSRNPSFWPGPACHTIPSNRIQIKRNARSSRAPYTAVRRDLYRRVRYSSVVSFGNGTTSDSYNFIAKWKRMPWRQQNRAIQSAIAFIYRFICVYRFVDLNSRIVSWRTNFYSLFDCLCVCVGLELVSFVVRALDVLHWPNSYWF